MQTRASARAVVFTPPGTRRCLGVNPARPTPPPRAPFPTLPVCCRRDPEGAVPARNDAGLRGAYAIALSPPSRAPFVSARQGRDQAPLGGRHSGLQTWEAAMPLLRLQTPHPALGRRKLRPAQGRMEGERGWWPCPRPVARGRREGAGEEAGLPCLQQISGLAYVDSMRAKVARWRAPGTDALSPTLPCQPTAPVPICSGCAEPAGKETNKRRWQGRPVSEVYSPRRHRAEEETYPGAKETHNSKAALRAKPDARALSRRQLNAAVSRETGCRGTIGTRAGSIGSPPWLRSRCRFSVLIPTPSHADPHAPGGSRAPRGTTACSAQVPCQDLNSAPCRCCRGRLVANERQKDPALQTPTHAHCPFLPGLGWWLQR